LEGYSEDEHEIYSLIGRHQQIDSQQHAKPLGYYQLAER
jgi:hypothetical protein